MLRRTSVTIGDEGRWIVIADPDGECSRFHAFWLRDNGQDPATRDPRNGQKLLRITDVPERTRVKSARLDAEGTLHLEFGPDGWRTVVDVEWLWEHRYDRDRTSVGVLVDPARQTWGAELGGSLPRVAFRSAKDDPRALYEWLRAFDRLGVGIVHGVAVEPGSVLDVVDLFGYVRETNYGRLFEIRVAERPENLASSALELQAHTDNPYRDPVPTVQVFTCLRNDAEGGESVVVDGFRAAERLKAEAPACFERLSRHSAAFDYHGQASVHLRAERPVIECSPEGALIAVRFNNRAADAVTSVPFAEMEAYYDAYRRFARLIDDPQAEVCFKLQPGEALVTDNTRVLHARKAFTGGGRWMQGAYADKDTLESRLRVLAATLGVSPGTPAP